MEYLKGQSRTQLTLYTTCLEDMIPEDNSVRYRSEQVHLF
jgi:transposase